MSDIESLIKKATSDPQRGAPGLVFQAVERNGNIVSSVASGLRSLDEKAPMTQDTVFWYAPPTCYKDKAWHTYGAYSIGLHHARK